MTERSFDHVREMAGIFKGATINLFGMASHLALFLGYSVFLARVLNPDELGRYFLGYTVLNFLIFVSLLGLNFTVWRYVAMYVGEGKWAKARGVVVAALVFAGAASIVVGLALFAGSNLIGRSIFHDDGLGLVFRMFALTLPFMIMARVLNSSTQGLRKMHYQVISRNLGEQTSKFVLSAALLSFGLTGIMMANVAAGAISAALAFLFLQRCMPIVGRSHEIENQFKLVAAFSFPLVFSSVLGFLSLWIDTLLLGYYRGSGDVGLYSIAGRVAIVGTLVLVSFDTTFSPVISDLYNRWEIDRLAMLFRFVTKWTVIISLPIFMTVVIFAEPALKIFGDSFVVVSTSLIILGAGQFINSATGPVGGMVLMSGHPYLDLMNNILSVATNVILCIILIPRLGILGAAIANAVATGSINVIRALEVLLIIKVQGYDRTYAKPVLAALVAAGLTYYLHVILGAAQQWTFGVLIATFISVYSIVLVLLGLSEDDRAMARLVKDRLVSMKSA